MTAENLLQQIEELIDANEFLNGQISVYDVCTVDDINNEGIENFDHLNEQFDDNGHFNVDVIYYSNAMEFLSENDSSLQLSFKIALEMGCTLENLNSETLASLLKTEKVKEAWAGLKDEIDQLFEEYREAKEDDEE